MPDELLMRQVPQDLTAEQSLLGAMLVDPNCIPEVIEQVRADDFTRKKTSAFCRPSTRCSTAHSVLTQ